jgi:alkyl sulfatase BDS1-like metallo-beta-lactamase superfamily hydrolase
MAGGMWRERPGADALSPATEAPADLIGERVWMSTGMSNSYCLGTDDGRVVINTGMGFEGVYHRRKYDDACPGPTRAVILTQGHFDHVGGVDGFLEPDGTTDVIAQASWRTWRDDNERLERHRSSKSAFAFIEPIMAAMQHAAKVGAAAAQSKPNPTLTFADRLGLDVGGRRMELLAVPGGETTDSLVVWLPEERTAFTGNLFGPLFGHVPNLVTIRGDRYRDPLEYIRSITRVLDLAPARLVTGHFQPIEGADRIAEEITAMRDAMEAVHDQVIDGMNAGLDVYTLMREVRVPVRLDVGEGYGKTAWNVRAIYELYTGWFHHDSTTELYPIAPTAVADDIVAVAGADGLVAAARTRLELDNAVGALQLTDLVLTAEPRHRDAIAVAIAAHEALLAASTNFWESAWLRRSIAELHDANATGAVP